MANRTFIEIPKDIVEQDVLSAFLHRLVEKLDVVFGNRNSSGFKASAQDSNATGNFLFSSEISDLIDSSSTNNAKQTAIPDCVNETETISASYVKTEVEALKSGVDENKDNINKIIQLLKDADLMEA